MSVSLLPQPSRLSLASVPAALATPVATSDAEYQALGRVFPDPLAGCQHVGTEPCSPNAQGNVPAAQFIQFQEFLDALKYMNQQPEWQRYMEVWPLDGKLGDGAGTRPRQRRVPGQQPRQARVHPEEGVPVRRPGDDHARPQEVRPDRRPRHRRDGARRGQEALRAVAVDPRHRARRRRGRHARDGGPRHRAARPGWRPSRSCPSDVKAGAPTFADVLKKTIIYFTYPNPDGWRRGSVTEGGVFFQRYNGNGVDLNRDWPDIGFSFRPYSGLSEPESRGAVVLLRATSRSRPARSSRPATTCTASRSPTRSPTRCSRTAARLRQGPAHPRDGEDDPPRLREGAAVVADRAAERRAAGRRRAVRAERRGRATMCAQIYGQTWGTVYDTINYTTTGALGDWFDSSIGPRRGRHRQRDVVLAPRQEHHLRPAHRAAARGRQQGADLRAPGGDRRAGDGHASRRRGARATCRTGGSSREAEGRADRAAAEHGGAGRHQRPARAPSARTATSCSRSTVKRTKPTQAAARASTTAACASTSPTQNVQGIGTGMATLKVQCRGCDQHVGVAEDDEWVTVAEDFNQSRLYVQAGVTAAVNRPEALKADGTPVEWRAVVNGPTAVATHGRRLHVRPGVDRRRHGRRRAAGGARLRRRQHRLLRRPEQVHPERRRATSARSTRAT